MNSEKKRRGWVEPSFYAKIQKVMPITCVDVVVQRSDGKFLLLKRNNSPAKDKWWTPGGKLDKGERLARAVVRIVQAETGLKIRVVRQIGPAFEMFFKKGHFGGSVHVVEIVFLARLIQGTNVKMDSQHVAWRWASRLPKHLPWASIANEAAVPKD